MPAVLVRPYGADVRASVHVAVARAGWRLLPLHVVAPRTPDDQALAFVRGVGARVLIVPFHAHRDDRGEFVDGLSLLHKLAVQVPMFPWRVLMPISRTGAAALGLRLARLPEGDTAARTTNAATLLLDEDDLAGADTSFRIDRHLTG